MLDGEGMPTVSNPFVKGRLFIIFKVGLQVQLPPAVPGDCVLICWRSFAPGLVMRLPEKAHLMKATSTVMFLSTREIFVHVYLPCGFVVTARQAISLLSKICPVNEPVHWVSASSFP